MDYPWISISTATLHLAAAAADDDDERRNMNLFNGVERLPTSLRVLVIVKTIKH